MTNLNIIPAAPCPLGCYADEHGIHVSAAFHGGLKCGILLHNRRTGKEELHLLPESVKTGHIYSATLITDADTYDRYCLYEDGRTFIDSHARAVIGLETWGVNTSAADLRVPLQFETPDFTGDHNPHIALSDTFLYLLHVRGFTMDPKSGVSKEKRGTFAGIIEKIPYLKDLGVTAVELMPAYEMNIVTLDAVNTDGLYVADGRVMTDDKGRAKLNYWGFKEGYYFAPRAAYASDKRHPGAEFASLIRALHDNGMELIMQFYFPNRIPEALMTDCIRYWVYTYHIDGIHLKGERIPTGLIARDPLLQQIKIFHDDFDAHALFEEGAVKIDAMIAEYRNDFRISASRFLKGDDSTLNDFIRRMNHTGTNLKCVNYVGNYDGFTVADMVSYEHKHNELNGENNMDGEDRNFSWNCGIEGKTRKKSVTDLRKKQAKNLLTMLFFSQGTPMLHAGDEFFNSQEGNNNPYCQDNKLGWTNWSYLEKNRDLYEYVKWLAAFRKRYQVLHNGNPFSMTDTKFIGYPDLSFHGIEAWRPDLSNYAHAIGFLYCGIYAGDEEPFLYVAFNMHWADIKLALPSLPEGMRWVKIADTSKEPVSNIDDKCPQTYVRSSSRSVQILISEGSSPSGAARKRKRN